VNVAHFDYGYPTENLFTARLGLFEADYPTPEACRRFYDALLRDLEEERGVRSVALTSDLPGRGAMMQPLTMEGVAYATDKDHPLAHRVVVTPRYFDTIDVAPIRGRVFARTDGPDGAPVAVVNERFVSLFFPNEDPLGRRIKLGDENEPWLTIVGVVPDLHLGGAIGFVDPKNEGVYIPLSQNTINFMSIMMRTEEAPTTYTAMVQDRIQAIDPTLPIYWVRSLSEQYRLDTWFYRAFGTLFMSFGVAALILATIGLYGVMSFSAQNRTREIGIRMALGAGARSVLALILRFGAIQLGVGLLLGVALAAFLSRALGMLLVGVDPWDPAIFGIVLLTLAATGILASFIPARRATRVDPVDALTYE
jgi:putative ABC transport system permease protein